MAHYRSNGTISSIQIARQGRWLAGFADNGLSLSRLENVAVGNGHLSRLGQRPPPAQMQTCGPICIAFRTGHRYLTFGKSPLKTAITVRIEAGLLEAVRRCAQQENRTLTNFIETTLRRRLCDVASETDSAEPEARKKAKHDVTDAE